MQLTPADDSPVVVCATLSGETHVLGLQMAATALAFASWDVRFVGADTPVRSVATMARTHSARAVCIGSSARADPEALAARLIDLRERVGGSVQIWLGGSRVPAAATVAVGVDSFSHLMALAANVKASP